MFFRLAYARNSAARDFRWDDECGDDALHGVERIVWDELPTAMNYLRRNIEASLTGAVLRALARFSVLG